MAEYTRSEEAKFVRSLLGATQAGRVAWEGTIRPGCYQVAVRDHIVAIAHEGAGIFIRLHHRSGLLLATLQAETAAAPTDAGETTETFAQIYTLAHARALGLADLWSQLARELLPQEIPENAGL